MRLSEFEFSIKELSGALGDFGTLLPFAIGFVVINGMNPASFLFVFGLCNIATGIIYRAPMPLQPMKAIAAIAIASRWSPDLITASALSMGLFWLILSLFQGIEPLIRQTPPSVVRGVQLALGLSLMWSGISSIRSDSPALGVVAIGLILFLSRAGRRSPVALIILVGGILIALSRGAIPDPIISLSRPDLAIPDVALAWRALYSGGVAQIPLTFTNAVIACCALLTEYFPNRKIAERQLMANMGVMNIGASFLGGFPVCHGAGGLASHYYFGARTGGANIMEGILEVGAGLILGSSLVTVFTAFPEALVGGMMVMVGVELGRFTLGVDKSDLPVVVVTTIAGIYWNLGVGFVLGLLAYWLMNRLSRQG